MNTFILTAIGVFLLAQTVVGAETVPSCNKRILYTISMTPAGVDQVNTLRAGLRSVGLNLPATQNAEASARRAGRAMREVRTSMIEIPKSYTQSDLDCAKIIQAKVAAASQTFGVQLPEIEIRQSNTDQYGRAVMLYWAADFSNIITVKQDNEENRSY